MTKNLICDIQECGKPAKYSGLCSMHAERKRKHGDPMLGTFKPKGGCSVSGCAKPHYGVGYCSAHYKRFKKWGSPTAGSTEKGAVKAWLKTAIEYAGDECLIFPFSRTPSGYGHINDGGKYVGAHVYVALAVHGEKPTRDHEACHTCGNGHIGCVTPGHLYWGTRTENVRDAHAHGTAHKFPRVFGENAPSAKYSADLIAQVKAMIAMGVRDRDICAALPLSQNHINNIRHGKVRVHG